MFIDVLSTTRSYSSFLLRYLAPGALPLGEGDAAGEGLAAGLGLVAGAVAPLDEAGEGLAVFGEFESLAASQPTAKTIKEIVRSRSAARLIRFIFVVIISFWPRSSKIEKRDHHCPMAK
jgi:hypothetical protein